MDNAGWVKIHRKLMESPIWKIKPFSPGQAWVEILMKATHSSFRDFGESFELGPGQLFYTESSFSSAFGWSRSKVRRFIKNMVNQNMIKIGPKSEQKKDTKKTVITIEKWDTYQKDKTQKGHEKDNEKTIKRQSKDTPLIDNKNDKNEEKVKKEDPYAEKQLIEKNNNSQSNTSFVFPKPKKPKRSFKTQTSDFFEEFWEQFPKRRKGSKPKAYQIWQEFGFDRETPGMTHARNTILADLADKKQNDTGWLRGFEPMATTYLNAAGWETPTQKGEPKSERHNGPKGMDDQKWEEYLGRFADEGGPTDQATQSNGESVTAGNPLLLEPPGRGGLPGNGGESGEVGDEHCEIPRKNNCWSPKILKGC